MLKFLIANFGLNLWLKYQLPNYIKNNSDYKISYKTLDVDLISRAELGKGIVYYFNFKNYSKALAQYLIAFKTAENSKDNY